MVGRDLGNRLEEITGVTQYTLLGVNPKLGIDLVSDVVAMAHPDRLAFVICSLSWIMSKMRT